LEASAIFLTSFGILYIGKVFGKDVLDSINDNNKEIAIKENKYKVLFESTNDSRILTSNGVFFDCNSKAFELFEGDKEYLLGTSPLEISPQISNKWRKIKR